LPISVIFIKLDEENNRPIGANPPHLVTLLPSRFDIESVAISIWRKATWGGFYETVSAVNLQTKPCRKSMLRFFWHAGAVK
jgi:hypothetical protein